MQGKGCLGAVNGRLEATDPKVTTFITVRSHNNFALFWNKTTKYLLEVSRHDLIFTLNYTRDIVWIDKRSFGDMTRLIIIHLY